MRNAPALSTLKENVRLFDLFSVRSPLTDEMCISLSLSDFNASSSCHNMTLAERRIKASTRRERQRQESVNIHACRFKARPRN